MSMEHCESALPSSTRLVRVTWLLGCVFSSIAYGALLVLGQSCFVALRQRKRGSSKVNRALAIYVLLTVALGTVAEAIDIEVTINGVLDDTCFFNNLQPPNPYLGRFALLFLFVNLTTDGLLVWRCYAISRSLQGNKGLSILLWALPLVVYIAMIGTGVTVAIRLSTKAGGGIAEVLTPLQWGISAFLNVLITSSIVILILRYRRATARAFGKDHPLPFLDVLTLLIESASLILVVDVFAIIGVIYGPLGNIATQLWIPMQPIASLLIIYRVSRGSDYFSRQSEEPSLSTLEPSLSRG